MNKTLYSQSAAIVAIFSIMFAKAAVKNRSATYFQYTGGNTIPELTDTLNWITYLTPPDNCIGSQLVCTAESVVYTSGAAIAAYVRLHGTLPPSTILVIDSKKMLGQ